MYTTPIKILQLEKGDFHTLLNGTVAGHKVRIVLDTGASHTCVDRQYVNEILPDLHLEANEGVNAGIGGTGFEVLVADLPDVRIGRFHLKTFPNTAVIDFSYINDAYRKLRRKPIHLSLGNDFCVNHKAVIDYENNRFCFRK